MQISHTEKNNTTCPRCGSSNLTTHARVFADNSVHLETRCDAGHFIEFSWQGRALEIMPFGMYKGQPIKNLPRDYCRWLLSDKVHIGKSLRHALEILSGEGGFACAEGLA
jgi:uncharacterized protein (DUF3820 family)